jgi:hypothetical protein
MFWGYIFEILIYIGFLFTDPLAAQLFILTLLLESYLRILLLESYLMVPVLMLCDSERVKLEGT